MKARKITGVVVLLATVMVAAAALVVGLSTRGNRMNKDEAYRRLLAKQLVMNEETWAALQKQGVTERTELRLDFSYAPSSKANAAALAKLLKEKTDYEVRTEHAGLLNRKQAVSGTTRATTISKVILDQWVDWMVTAGIQCGCEFDGWGTEIPESAGQHPPAN